MRWILVVLLALVLLNGLAPLLERLGLGRLPGDLRFRLFGRDWYLPVATTLILSAAASLLAHFL
jgi:hypothetical protein